MIETLDTWSLKFQVKTTLGTSGEDAKTTLQTSGEDAKTTFEASGEVAWTTLQTSGEDAKTTLQTSGEDAKTTFEASGEVAWTTLETSVFLGMFYQVGDLLAMFLKNTPKDVNDFCKFYGCSPLVSSVVFNLPHSFRV